MSDKELLELAAKAAGYELKWYSHHRKHHATHIEDLEPQLPHLDDVVWNPLTDDGDAQRLAVKLNMHVLRFDNMTTVKTMFHTFAIDERDDGNANAATRRAIVRAAAAIATEKGEGA